MKKALTIAAIDTSGGAGVLADIKTFSSFGVYGMGVITAVTAQNTVAVKAIHELPPDMMIEQIRAIIEDIGVDAAKTGVLCNEEIIKSIASFDFGFPLIVDPVMVSKSGVHLLKEAAIDAFKRHIIPIATLITPNKMEAEKLSGIEIKSIEDAVKAAEIIADMGANYVLIKGGHFEGKKATDILYHNGKIKKFSSPWQQGCTHGVGCSFSAAITANLAKGKRMHEAIKIAKDFITMAIKYGANVGKGYCPVNPIAYMHLPSERWIVYSKLKKAVDEIMACNDFINFIPEVGTNFAYALPREYVNGINDIAAIEGRIVKGKKAILKGEIKFGVSRHLAKAIIKAMEYDENTRAVMNIKYDEGIIKTAENLFTVSYYKREEEPNEVKKREGATIPWGIEHAIRKARKVPDIVYHEGDIGKEPMILIFGKEPAEVVKKFNKLRKAIN